MKKYRITLAVRDKEFNYSMIRNNSDLAPTEDFILRDFSKHYHRAYRAPLPANSKVLKIEEV